MGEIQAGARFQHYLAAAGFTTPGRYVGSGRELFLRGNAAVGYSNAVLHHDDAVGTGWNRGSGHDLNRLADADQPRLYLTGADFAGHFQTSGQVGGSYGKAIADGAVERGIIPVCRCIRCQHASRYEGQWDQFDAGWQGACPDLPQYGGSGIKKR